jgi:acetyltransferase-like isoleucine patch superfamily enzyme
MFDFLPRLFRRRKRSRRDPIRGRFPVGRATYGEPKVLQWGEHAALRIGSFCSIAPGVTIILDGDHRVDWVTTYPFPYFRKSARGIPGHPRAKGEVVIENDVWIGYGATILSGVRIGNGAVVAACSVVTKDVPPYAIVAGNPAKVLRQRFSDETIQLLERLAWWNWDDAALDKAMPLLLSEDVAELARFAVTELGLDLATPAPGP